MEKKNNRYLQIIESIFDKHYKRGATAIEFTREDIVTAAQRLKVALPKNLGDVLYSSRYRDRVTAQHSTPCDERARMDHSSGRTCAVPLCSHS